MIFSDSNKNIASALAKSWAAIESPKHNAKVQVSTRKGGKYTFEYTDLNGILAAVRPIFIENKLTIMQNSYSTIENGITLACVETTFLHESGEYAKSYPLKFPAAESMQDFGGQITYMKRYSLAAMLGIATEKDDDANGSSGNSYQYENSSRQQSPSQNSRQGQSNVSSVNLTVPFGHHKGKTLGQIFNEEPKYLFWLAENAQRQDLRQGAAELASRLQQQEPQPQPQPQEPANGTWIIDAPTMQSLTNVLIPLAKMKNMQADVLYNNSLNKLQIPAKKTKELTMKEASRLINYLQQVTRIAESKATGS